MVRSVNVPCPDPPKDAYQASSKWESRTYIMDVVTPLFGGGPVPGQNDPVTLIRVPSIRGQLRFWWRATRGASCKTVEELREKEGKIWGTPESPSPVTIRVYVEKRGRQERWANYEEDRKRGGVRSLPTPANQDYPPYALFPFQGSAKKVGDTRRVIEHPSQASVGVSFKLILEWPNHLDLSNDVELAVWAWTNFGGIGARTRRGCGSLYCREFSPKKNDIDNIKEWYISRLHQYGIELPKDLRQWPILPCAPLIKHEGSGVSLTTPLKAWKHAIEVLHTFRQGVDIGRGPGSNGRPGRSYWPEADSLRRITKQSLPRHKKSITTQENAFPRAELGLPIVFHFQYGNEKGHKPDPSHDPGDCEVLPQGPNRMASPLILKPLAISTTEAIPMILQMKNMPLTEGKVTFEGGSSAFDSTEIRRPDLTTYPHSPMAGRSKNGSALEAFIAFAKERGFKYE